MSILPIIVAPDPRLKSTSEVVKKVTKDIVKFMDDMLETMYDAPGIGLAAPQVGLLKRIIVADVSKEDEKREAYQMINPEIIWLSDEMFECQEGCLSLPEQYAEVARPKKANIRYLDRNGVSKTLEAEDLLAVCLQHEIDHLEGVLFVDHISMLKRNVIMRKLRKIKKIKPNSN